MTGAEIHCKLLPQYSDSVVLQRSVNEWMKNIKSGQTSMMQEEAGGHPSTSTTDKKIQQAQEIVTVNWLVIINDVAYSLQIQITASCSSLVHSASTITVATGAQTSIM